MSEPIQYIDDEVLAKLFKDGKITSQQYGLLLAWEAVKPDPNARPQEFEAWLKTRPYAPGFEEWLKVKPSMKPSGPPPPRDMDEMLAKLLKDGKITQQKADQFKAWEAAKPGQNASPQKLAEWLKSRPKITGV